MVLEAIAGAAFVAFDLEMSGIKVGRDASSNKVTMQQAYKGAKEAAQTYQILQLGLTCVAYDGVGGLYSAKTFNFDVTPLFVINSRPDRILASIVDRKLTLSYASFIFLEQHGFRLEDAFQKGVPYLSRGEKAFAEGHVHCRDLKELIDYNQLDKESQEFYRMVGSALDQWLETPEEAGFLNIENPYGGNINSRQRNIIQQLLQTTYSQHSLVANMKSGIFMQITRKDDAQEQKVAAKRYQERMTSIRSQSGLRYIFEALAGGTFADEVNLDWIKDSSDASDVGQVDAMRAKLRGLEHKLKQQAPILVGHNALHDLMFIGEAFFTTLPDNVGHFAHLVGNEFPRIVDTKYLATEGGHEMLPDQNLGQLYNQVVQDQELPRITRAAPEFGYADGETRVHNAGFDSWMTAVVFVKSSYKMAQEQDLEQISIPSSMLPAPLSERLKAATTTQSLDHASIAQEHMLMHRSDGYVGRYPESQLSFPPNYGHYRHTSPFDHQYALVGALLLSQGVPQYGGYTPHDHFRPDGGFIPDDGSYPLPTPPVMQEPQQQSKYEPAQSHQGHEHEQEHRSHYQEHGHHDTLPSTSSKTTKFADAGDKLRNAGHQIPAWESKFFAKYGNIIRVPRAGGLRLGSNHGVQGTLHTPQE